MNEEQLELEAFKLITLPESSGQCVVMEHDSLALLDTLIGVCQIEGIRPDLLSAAVARRTAIAMAPRHTVDRSRITEEPPVIAAEEPPPPIAVGKEAATPANRKHHPPQPTTAMVSISINASGLTKPGLMTVALAISAFGKSSDRTLLYAP